MKKSSEIIEVRRPTEFNSPKGQVEPVRDRLLMVPTHVLMILIQCNMNLFASVTEVELQCLLLISHLRLYHLCNFPDVVVERLLNVELQTPYLIDMFLNPLQSNDPLSETEVAPPTL